MEIEQEKHSYCISVLELYSKCLFTMWHQIAYCSYSSKLFGMVLYEVFPFWSVVQYVLEYVWKALKFSSVPRTTDTWFFTLRHLPASRWNFLLESTAYYACHVQYVQNFGGVVVSMCSSAGTYSHTLQYLTNTSMFKWPGSQEYVDDHSFSNNLHHYTIHSNVPTEWNLLQ